RPPGTVGGDGCHLPSTYTTSSEGVRDDALGAECVPGAERETDRADGGCNQVERSPDRSTPERSAPACRKQSHRQGGEEREEGERDDREHLAVNRREQEQAHSGGASQSVNDPDRVGLGPGTCPLMLMHSLVDVGVAVWSVAVPDVAISATSPAG